MASRRYTRDLLVKPTGLISKNDMISMRSPSSNAIKDIPKNNVIMETQDMS